MAGVFKLQAADVYRVLAIEQVPGHSLAGTAPQRQRLGAVRAIAERIASCADLSNLLDAALAALDDALGIRHAMILMADDRAERCQKSKRQISLNTIYGLMQWTAPKTLRADFLVLLLQPAR